MKQQRQKSLIPELPASLWWLFPVVSIFGAISVRVWGVQAAEFPGLEPFLRPSGALMTGLILGLFTLLFLETLLWRRWRTKLNSPEEQDWPSKAFASCQRQVGGGASTTTVDLRIAVVSQTRAEIDDAGAVRLRWYATFALGPLFGAGYAFVREVQTVGQSEPFSALMYPGSVVIIVCFTALCWVHGLWWMCRTATIEWQTWAREEWELSQGATAELPPTTPQTLAAPRTATDFTYAANNYQGPPPPPPPHNPPPGPAPQPTPPPAPAPFNPFGGPVPGAAAVGAAQPTDEVTLTDRDICEPDAVGGAVVDPLLGATSVATEYRAAPAAASWPATDFAAAAATTSSDSAGNSEGAGANRETTPVDMFDL